MLITNVQKTINLGGNRTESRTLVFEVGIKSEGYANIDGVNVLMANFPVKVYKELTALEALDFTAAGIEIMTNSSDGRVFMLIDQRNAQYKKSTLDVVVGDTLYRDFETVKYNLMKLEIDRVTSLFDTWDAVEQMKVGDYYGVTAAELDDYVG